MIRAQHISIAFLVALLVLPFATYAQSTGGDGQTTGGADAQTTTTPPPTPPSASDQFKGQNEGIFGCGTQAGAPSMSVGAAAAVGGVYVPVNDAAVTANTYNLLYKECVLRVIVDRTRESASSALLKRAQTSIETGKQGAPQYSTNPSVEDQNIRNQLRLLSYQDGTTNYIDPRFRQTVLNYNAQNYKTIVQNPASNLTCPVQTGSGVWSGILSLQYMQCNPYGVETLLEDNQRSREMEGAYYNQEQRQIGRGFYPITDNAQNPLGQRIYTPSSVVQESYQQLLGSPVRQLENANDVGQMIGALFAGITTQVLSDSRGMYGLSQPIGTQPSYINQVAAESSSGLRNAAVNAALQILASARQVESDYFQATVGIVNSITQLGLQLRADENQCWNTIIPKVQDYATQNNINLRIATSTAFSQGVISSQLATPLTSWTANAKAAQQSGQLVDQLIAGLTNTTSLDAQRIALQQLDSLVAQHALHTRYDVQNAQKAAQDVQGTLQKLREDTVTAWTTSTDLGLGWCNINVPPGASVAPIIPLWANKWKQ